jgi:hypothetical protein
MHQTALAEFAAAQSFVREERKQCLEDRRFCMVLGAQWEGDFSAPFENRPRLEVNKAQASITRIISEYRANRISVDFIPKDGGQSDKLADACDSLYRADEMDSGFEAYDNAFEEAVSGGFGAWRVIARHEDEYDEENEFQRIRLEPIFDADTTVFFDSGSLRQDKGDARYCFVLTPMTIEAYREEWGDDLASWPKDIRSNGFDWVTPDQVFVAEYYKVEDRKERVSIYQTLGGAEERYTDAQFEADPDLEARLAGVGTNFVRDKKTRVRKVRKVILSGGGVLEDCGHIAGTEIPIIPVYAKRAVIDGVERCISHVRFVKDAQRLKNMQLSRLAEIASLSTISKPIFTPEQIAGHENAWASDAVVNAAYMLVNPIMDANNNEMAGGPVGYTKPPEIPAATAALLQITEQDMQDLLGNQQAGEEVQANVSGKAVELVQNRLDMQAAIYMTNMSKSIKRCGEVWLSMAREVYIEDDRKMKAIEAHGEASQIVLNRPILNDATKEVEREIDLTRARFDVAVDVGPTSSSRRAATVRALTGMIGLVQDPQTAQVLSAAAMTNMEGEGLPELRAYFRKQLVSMGALDPTDDEKAEMAAAAQNVAPDANQVFLMASAKEAEAKAIKAQADTEYAVARAGEAKANTLETLAGIDREDQRAVLDVAQKIGAAVTTPQPSGGQMQARQGQPL